MENHKPGRINVFQYNLYILHILGLWSFSNSRKGYPIYSAIFISLFGLFLITCLISLFFVLDDMKNVANTLSVSFTNITNLIKMIPLLFQKEKIKSLIDDLENHLYPWGTEYQTQEKYVILNKIQRNGKIRQMLYMSLFLITTVVACYRPLLLEEMLDSSNTTLTQVHSKPLPFVAWFPFNYEDSPMYEMTYIFQTVSSIIDSSQASAMDLFYLALIIHTSCLFQMLKISLRNVHDTALQRLREASQMKVKVSETDSNLTETTTTLNGNLQDLVEINAVVSSYESYSDTIDESTMGKEMIHCLNECIRYHQDILRYAENVRKLLSPLMLAECLNITVILCMITFHATSFPLGSVGFLNILSFFMCEMLQLLQYCWFGSNLLWESSSVKDAVYESQWYSSPSSFKHSVKIIMLQAQKPAVINALFFSRITLDIFSVLLRASYSYYAVLRQLDSS